MVSCNGIRHRADVSEDLRDTAQTFSQELRDQICAQPQRHASMPRYFPPPFWKAVRQRPEQRWLDACSSRKWARDKPCRPARAEGPGQALALVATSLASSEGLLSQRFRPLHETSQGALISLSMRVKIRFALCSSDGFCSTKMESEVFGKPPGVFPLHGCVNKSEKHRMNLSGS